MFRVAVKDDHEIYSINDVKYSISKNNLYVTVGIPITLQESTFDVYQVTTMYIAVSNNVNTQLSKLSNVADYLAINFDHSYFLELSSVDLLHCKDSDVKRCFKPFVFNYADTMTCTLALFKGIKDEINILHQSELRTFDPDAKQVQYISDGVYFVGFHNGSYFDEICNDEQPRKFPSCSLCLIKLKCGCTLESEVWLIPPSINGCHDVSDTEVRHPVNLMIPPELNG